MNLELTKISASNTHAIPSNVAAKQMRQQAVAAIHNAGGGHFGGTLSAIDLLAVLISRFGWYPQGREGDKIVLSKGHSAMALYAGLVAYGHLGDDWLDRFGQSPDELQGHPDMNIPVPLCFSTGSLGQGLSAALGMAKVLQPSGYGACVVLGDGECQEGQVWEAAMLAQRLKLDNLMAVIDANDHQEWGYREAGEAMPPITDLAEKWAAFGWSVGVCDGHDHVALLEAVENAHLSKQPSVIIAKTIKGYGAKLIRNDPDRFHCGELTEDEFQIVQAELCK